MDIRILDDDEELARQAASFCAGVINKAVRDTGYARIILATGNSQLKFLNALVASPVNWDKVTCFHLDEYVDLPADHMASFRNYLQTRVWDKVKMAQVHPLDPANTDRYAQLLMEEDIHLACVGIGENGHLAFNDPPAKLDDEEVVKIVELDQACRMQQVGEGWFKSIEETPTKAATLTIPAILRAKVISCVVPEARKANAVCHALTDPISGECPASALRKHPHMVMWLDGESSSLCRKKVRRQSSRTPAPLCIPGLVDLQVNGYKGVNFSSSDLTEETFKSACDDILKSVAFMFVPTVITSSMATYEHVLPIIAKVIRSDARYSSRIPGIHLEGPFISREGKGCHNEAHIQDPSIKVFEQLQQLANGCIALVTMAAELPGSADLSAYITAQGVRVSLGHHLAKPQDLSNMCRAGASMLTHLGNGMPKSVHRHANPLIAGLGEDRLLAGIISDGHHIPNELIKIILRTKGYDKVIVTSDMTHIAGQEPGEYMFCDAQVVLEENGRLHFKDQPDLLAGSSSTILQCANHLLHSELIDLMGIERMCFYNPLRLLGIDPERIRADSNPMISFVNGTLELL